MAARWKKEHGLSTGVGVGIESGEVVVGNVGAPSFMSYTIIGDSGERRRAADAAGGAQRGADRAAAPRCALGARLAGGADQLQRRSMELKGKAEPVEVVSLRVAPAG